MFVNDINSTLLQRQNLAELQERAAQERLAHEFLRARREAGEPTPGAAARIGRLVRRVFALDGARHPVQHRPAQHRPAQHRTAH